ncbi:ABC transporter permease [Ectobacillus polymachus]|uniref:ABC transporter permease n=1 Tax=Ectobacillus polymachus TaxID=1508806 RepID=UPI003A849A14
MSLLRKYWEMLKVQIKLETSYAAWYWAGTFAIIVKLCTVYYFWTAVYENKETVGTLSLSNMLTYMVVAMLLEQYVSGVGNNLARMIKQGDIAMELMKPYHLLDKLVAMDIGQKISNSIRTTIPMLLFATWFVGNTLPQSLESFALFMISVVLGILIGTQLDLIIGILAFWTVNVWGLRLLRDSIIQFCSGALVPLSLYPQWFQEISMFLPFQSMVYIPVSIYTGSISGTQAYMAIATQFVWFIFIAILVRFIWAFAIRKITIFGG